MAGFYILAFNQPLLYGITFRSFDDHNPGDRSYTKQ
jgi:hypothetical protein